MVFTASMIQSLAVCAFYGLSSITLSLVNKAIMSVYAFRSTFILLALQTLASFLFVSSIRLLRRYGVKCSAFPEIKPFSLTNLVEAVPFAVCGVLNVACGLLGLQLTPMPMFLCLRRTVVAAVVLGEIAILAKYPSRFTATAVGMLVLGALMVGGSHFSSNALGLFCVLGNNVLTALSLVLQKRFCDRTDQKGIAILWYNSMVAFPLCMGLAAALGEFEAMMVFPELTNGAFLVSMSISTCGGVLITYAIALGATLASPMAVAVTGGIKDLFTTFIGWALFGHFEATLLSVSGLAVSFLGAGTYSVGKYKEGQKNTAPSASTVEDGEPKEADANPDIPNTRSNTTSAVAPSDADPAGTTTQSSLRHPKIPSLPQATSIRQVGKQV